MFTVTHREPTWFKHLHGLGCVPPSSTLRSWLEDPRSTTHKLNQRMNGHFHIEVHQQDWVFIKYALTAWQPFPPGRYWQREVLQWVDGHPWMLASSYFPNTMMTAETGHAILHLNTTPLGQLIFDDPQTRRNRFLYTYLDDRHALYRRTSKLTQTCSRGIWGRRSAIHWRGHMFLLDEFFLPHPMMENRPTYLAEHRIGSP